MKDDSLYVPLHAGIWEHPKTKRLSRALGVSVVATVGHLGSLWTWAVRYAPDGDLSDFSARELADAGRWEGDADCFITCLKDAGWMDGSHLNDWESYAGEGLALRVGARERQRAKRAGVTVEEYRSRRRGHADVTPPVTDPVTPPSRDVTGDRNGSGPERIGTGTDRISGERESAPAPGVDRGKQNPGAPPPLPGKLLSDDEIAAIRMGRPPQRLGFGGVGFMEDPAKFPQDVDELITQHRADLVKSFPMLDGKPPRPSLRDAVASKWGAYVANRARNGGHANAYSALKTWLSEMAQKHRVSWEREYSTVVDDGVAKERTRELLKPLEGPHPSDDPEAAAEAAKAIEAIKSIGKPKPKEPKP